MALIDLTELLLDPDFVDQISIIHRVPTVNSFGQNVLKETVVNTLGSVQPASGKELQRLPESLRVKSVSNFFVKGQIVSDGTAAYPDILVFAGQRYSVLTIQDYGNWPNPSGWCQGLCVREVIAL